MIASPASPRQLHTARGAPFLPFADDAAYAQAGKAGATIIQELTDRDYGSREFICRDPQGGVWSFGTYWPKAGDKA